ncbi:short chain dehydrogenase reductase family protein [Purpureocillium lilacinum]|uniref:Short chain dehydrogenase reductase family protein n=2 Tax=Purpureocillium lilacinum TaxID=33203 RepID=A0A179HK29_PURLI|nr:short chain dehydrogenase reductase family protein [Purpureocillium lilacinum]OAQ90637.1 short chain dehydrogenase reductase family protein [Purpureocillium lilacinum]
MATTGELSRERLFDVEGRLLMSPVLAANGAKVYICGRSKDKLDRASETHGQDARGEIISLQADITTKKDIASLCDEMKSREEYLSILVNNAGISGETFPVTENKSAEDWKKSLFDNEKATFEDWVNVYRTNVAATYFTTVAMLPLLQACTERHPGWSATVINVTSISGLVKTSQHHFSYNASKAAAIHLTRMLASDIAATGLKIRVNSIAPGVFPSEMTAGESDKAQKSKLETERYQGKVPVYRPGKASAVLFTAGNQYLNGQTITVDGGYTLAAGL